MKGPTLVEGKQLAKVGDPVACSCEGGPHRIVSGAPTATLYGIPIARVGDKARVGRQSRPEPADSRSMTPRPPWMAARPPVGAPSLPRRRAQKLPLDEQPSDESFELSVDYADTSLAAPGEERTLYRFEKPKAGNGKHIVEAMAIRGRGQSGLELSVPLPTQPT